MRMAALSTDGRDEGGKAAGLKEDTWHFLSVLKAGYIAHSFNVSYGFYVATNYPRKLLTTSMVTNSTTA
jgi:hypothetical protein